MLEVALNNVAGGTGLSGKKPCSALGLAIGPLHSLRLSKAEKQHRQPVQDFTGERDSLLAKQPRAPLCFSRLLAIRQGRVSRSDMFKESIYDSLIFFPSLAA